MLLQLLLRMLGINYMVQLLELIRELRLVILMMPGMKPGQLILGMRKPAQLLLMGLEIPLKLVQMGMLGQPILGMLEIMMLLGLVMLIQMLMELLWLCSFNFLTCFF